MLIRTNLVRTTCWLVVVTVACAGRYLHREATRERDCVVSRECACECVAQRRGQDGGDTQEDMSGSRAAARSASELRGCECEMLRGMRLSEEREQKRVFRMVSSASEWC